MVLDLDDRRFAVRDKAAQELAKLDLLAKPALQKALAGKPSLEVRQRVALLLSKMEGPLANGETLRNLRAVEALEYMGHGAPRELLSTLAKGAPEARLSQDAKASLERLTKRSAGSR